MDDSKKRIQGGRRKEACRKSQRKKVKKILFSQRFEQNETQIYC